MSTADITHPGDRHTITRIDQPDWDHYAVIHYGRWAFGCGEAWFTENQPSVGATLIIGYDNHWHVKKPTR